MAALEQKYEMEPQGLSNPAFSDEKDSQINSRYREMSSTKDDKASRKRSTWCWCLVFLLLFFILGALVALLAVFTVANGKSLGFEQPPSAIPESTTVPGLPTTGPELAAVPLVQTNNGAVRGKVIQTPEGRYVQRYLGIPFAKPPVGQLRFADPMPADAWQTEYEAFEYGNSCIQFLDETYGDFKGSNMWNAQNTLSEDCLYMNIWVPHPRPKDATVMVWIYGGGFYGGSSALSVYDGQVLAGHTNVIVVSFNYRTGSLGFLSTGDGRIKGNFGLKDQVLALEWINQNIKAFGGNPEDVTLFGESAGAASIGFHLLYPKSSNYFKRGILQSGSPTAFWALMSAEQAKKRSQDFFNSLKCPNDAKILDCLRAKPTNDILNNEWVDARFLVFPWAPVVDGEVVPLHPDRMLELGLFQRKDILAGVNKDEGTFWILYGVDTYTRQDPSAQTAEQLKAAINVTQWNLPADNKTSLFSYYTADNPKNSTIKYRDALDDIVGDRSFICPTKTFSGTYTSIGLKTYFYQLTHRASNEVWPDWMGVIHGADCQWVFGMPYFPSENFTSSEQNFSDKIMRYWTNFAKTGNPNAAGLPRWPLEDSLTRQYLELRSPDNFVIGSSLRQAECAYWRDEIKDY
ncbi:acetylcholinesterase isoform X2 [Lingula anatina]|uniref:Carboxylic ester hydrolase n=1 Tax=Lingula anatina TaxID=7574 RepID=A0A1S3HD64_LINAN|nr:acetylcholinesterase isoform X2 [Lingula anatina]|eukprot:XP_013383940.2 acetylcholinesterase isoform X2 [Lingula anatina]